MAAKRKLDEAVGDDRGKVAKLAYNQRYLDKYSDIPGIAPSSLGSGHAYCKYCKTDFSITHSGKYDITRHVRSKAHSTKESLNKSTKSITSFMPQKTMGDDDKAVIYAETIMTEFFVKMNLPISAADMFTRIAKRAFPDSKIASRYECSRSKTTAIVKELASMKKETIYEKMKTRPFCIATDGSNDQREKQFPIVVTTVTTEGVNAELLGVPVLKMAATGQNIFNLLDHEMTRNGIPWENCLALSSDNASVMTGRNKGVFAFMLKKQPSLYLSGCPCHLLHHAAEKAAACLPFRIEEVLVDTYYYLDKSSKRQAELQEYQTLYDVAHHKILKHVSTRWLSVGTCLPRILENWDALKVFFVKQKESLGPADKTNIDKPTYKQSKVCFLESFFRSPTNKLYCLFLQHALVPIDKVNTILQADRPQIHTLRRTLHKLMRELLIRFVKPVALSGKSVTEVQFEREVNQKRGQDVIIGEAARRFIEQKKENHLRTSRLEEFYENIRHYYVAACRYIKEKLPLNDELLEHAEIADTDLLMHHTTNDLNYFLDRYPVLLPEGSSKDDLVHQLADLQSTDLQSLKKDRSDHTWQAIGQLRDAQGELRYRELSQVMLGILTISHSNAQCERIFSCVRKNKTDQRASLNSETLNAIMVVKGKPGDPVRVYTDNELKKLKSCYYMSLKQ